MTVAAGLLAAALLVRGDSRFPGAPPEAVAGERSPVRMAPVVPGSGPAAISTARSSAAAERNETLDRTASALREAAHLPSLSLAVLRDGEIVHAGAFGFADLEREVPATVDTRYRCASVSKVITVTALARLVADGRIDLDAPVARYVPSWPEAPAITPRMLAGHLAGIAHYQEADRIEPGRHYGSVSEALAVFRESPRAAPPGEEYAYSTHGYTLLSAAIEGAAGRPFLQVLETEVFAPLGMGSSGPDLRATPHPDMSTLYGRAGVDPVPIREPEDPSYKWAGGGLVAAPSDLVRLADAYLSGVLPPEVVDEMWTSQTTAAGEETGVGIGWRIGEDPRGERVIHHSGSMGGARTTLVLYPERGEAIAIMTNITWPSDIRATAMWMMELYRREEIGGAATPPIRTDGPRPYGGTFGEAGASGTLSFSPDGAWISTPEPFAEWSDGLVVDRMSIQHVRGGTWVLISPWGLYPLRIEARDGGIRGTGEFGSERWHFETSR